MSSFAVSPESSVLAGLGHRIPAGGAFRSSCALVTLALAIALGGCSADVTRFDASSLGLSETNGGGTYAPPRQTSGNAYAGDAAPSPSGNSYYVPPRASRPGEVRMSSLPEPAQPAPPPSTQAETRRPLPGYTPSHEPRPSGTPVSAAGKGEQIEVQQGDTLYALSKRHKVSIAELMSANDLKNPNLKPGQKLYLPAGRRPGGAQKPLARPEAVAAAPGAPAKSPTPVPSNWTGTYTIKPGDSLSVIARQHKVREAELQAVNGIADVRKVRPGTVIKVPEGIAAAAATPSPASEALASPGQQPTLLNVPGAGERQRVAAAPQAVTDAAPSADIKGKADQVASADASASGGVEPLPGGKLRWPVKGKVVVGFGPRPDGTHNDGVNLSVPLGADVHAAEAGVVAYAGNELKGYGNLVLIRHDNGWVTAYAHNDQLLVKRGDKIKRGQVVGKAGKTGTVDQPQVHFELRQGSKPIDPTPYMERL